MALAALQIDPLQTVTVEDSPGGVAAALAARVPVIVMRRYCFPNITVQDAIAIGPGFDTRRGVLPALPEPPRDGPVTLQDVTYWAERMVLVSQFE
ncbi:MAG: hypothetical protein NZL99_07525 [Burkholderiaceae bacterium]|nr:hypothetical protein [Burkholderiaceae bacterium]